MKSNSLNILMAQLASSMSSNGLAADFLGPFSMQHTPRQTTGFNRLSQKGKRKRNRQRLSRGIK